MAPNTMAPLAEGLRLSWPNPDSQSFQQKWTSQAYWKDAFTEVRTRQFDETAPARLVNLRTAQSGPKAGEWLLARPGLQPNVRFSNNEWQALLAFRTGASSNSPKACGGCGQQGHVHLPDHVASCHPCGLYYRHNTVRDLIANQCRESGWHTQVEVALPADPSSAATEATQLRPADIFLSNKGVHPVALDVGISHALRPSAPPAIKALAGESAVVHEDAKYKKYAAPCKSFGWIYRPLCFEATGAWGPSAFAFVRHMSKVQENKGGDVPVEVFNRLERQISTALAKGLAGMLVKGLNPLPR